MPKLLKKLRKQAAQAVSPSAEQQALGNSVLQRGRGYAEQEFRNRAPEAMGEALSRVLAGNERPGRITKSRDRSRGDRSATATEAEQFSRDQVFEVLAHDLAYRNSLGNDQNERLRKLGYSPEGSMLFQGLWDLEFWLFLPAADSSQPPVLAFRGTETDKNDPLSIVFDVMTDLDPRGIGHNQYSAGANQAKIHEAFAKVEEAFQMCGQKVVATGHSLGGALAQVAAALFPAQVGRVVTFQAPGIPRNLARRLNRRDAPKSTHYQMDLDVVGKAGEALTPGDVFTFSSGRGKEVHDLSNRDFKQTNFTQDTAAAHTAHILSGFREGEPGDATFTKTSTRQANAFRPIEALRKEVGAEVARSTQTVKAEADGPWALLKGLLREGGSLYESLDDKVRDWIKENEHQLDRLSDVERGLMIQILQARLVDSGIPAGWVSGEEQEMTRKLLETRQ